jgi:hypothetical protein
VAHLEHRENIVICGRERLTRCSCASGRSARQAHRSPHGLRCHNVRLCPRCNGVNGLTAAEQTRCAELMGKLTVRWNGGDPWRT